MKNQRGVALFISLVLLLVLTIIGVSAVQTTSMEERMARNTHDSVLAFEAAEVALRTGETFLRNNVNSVALFTPAGNNGLWKASDYGQTERWQQANVWTGANSVVVAANTIAGVAEQPRYIIEFVAPVQRSQNQYVLGTGANVGDEQIQIFRITARGVGGTTNARVLLQSTFGLIF